MKILKEKIEPVIMKVEFKVELDKTIKVDLDYLRKFINFMNLSVYTLALTRDNITYKVDPYDIENWCSNIKEFKAYLKENQFDVVKPINTSILNYDYWVIDCYIYEENYDFTVEYNKKEHSMTVNGTIEDYDYEKIKRAFNDANAFEPVNYE